MVGVLRRTVRRELAPTRLRPSVRHGALVSAALGVAALATLLAREMPAQQAASHAELARAAAEIRRIIAELEDTRKKIVDEGHVLVELGGAVALVERERVENLFILALREGKMDLDQVEPAASRVGQMTGIYVTQILDPQLASARRDLADLEARSRAPGPTTPTSVPGLIARWPNSMDWRGVRGVAAGIFAVPCSFGGRELPPVEGTFRLELTGEGTIRGTIVSDMVEHPVHGTIDANGNATGGGAGDMGSQFSWRVTFARSGDYLLIASGTVSLVPALEGAECRPTSLTQR
jgi:hypothetical protein